jgi:radical SAM protein with 4Fe4S-binding SPASM domain
MLLRLARQAYTRQFGEFTYVFGKVSAFDEVFLNAKVFLQGITRTPRPKDEILQEIFAAYVGADNEEIARDFDAFLAPLLASRIILVGETPEELDAQEIAFTYNCDDPKTVKSKEVISKEQFDYLPQNVLGNYFQENPTLFTLQMDITQACTERCRHCYVPEYNPVFLPYEKICEIVDEFRDMQGMHISLSGGECMMHPDFDRIVRYIRSRDCTVAVLSNLTLCDDAKVALLREADATAQVSLYSMNPEVHDEVTRLKGSWKRTMEAIVRLRAADIPLRISCPCMQINYHDYPAVIRFAESLKISAQTDFIIIAKADGDTSNLCNRLTIPQTRELLQDVILKTIPVQSEYFSLEKKEHMMTAEQWKASKICGAGIDSMCLNACGDYYPCPGFAGMPLGNCYEKSLREVWLNSPAIQKLRAVRGASFPKCAECKDRDYCSICMCRNFNETGDMFKVADHFCQVAAVNHEVVDEKQREMLAKSGK